MRISFLLLISLATSLNFIARDKTHEQKQTLSFKNKIEYIKLEDLKFQLINIAWNEEIEVLSFSGGKNCNDEHTIYKQFIGIRKLTGDTVRILSACQIYNSPKLGKIGYFMEDPTNPIVERKISSAKLVAFNKGHSKLERGNFKTCIGGLGFPEK